MNPSWSIVPLEELLQPGRGISYGIVQPGQPCPNGIPIVRVGDVRGGRVITSDPLRVSPEIESSYSRTRLLGGELLLTLVGTVGEAAIVPKSLAGWNTARAVAVIPVREDVGAYWVSMALKMPIAREMIGSRLNTTVQATLNLRDVAQLPIVLPPAAQRESIIGVLKALDDKIELNRKMGVTLEAMARALFRSWFVDFGPIRAIGQVGDRNVPREAGTAFPDGFQDSELGRIPKGWSVAGLDTVADFINGLALQRFPAVDGRSLPVIKIAQLRTGNTLGADVASADIDRRYVVGDGDVLFSWSGSLECVVWAGGPGALNQHLFKVTSESFPKWFYYYWIHHHLHDFRFIAAGKATTMGHIQRHHLSDAKVVVPSKPVLRFADSVISPLADRALMARLESRALEDLRDALLPKLMSGEISVGNVGSSAAR